MAFAIFSQPHSQFEAGPFESKEDADKHISRVLSNLPQGDLREFFVISLGGFPANGRTR